MLSTLLYYRKLKKHDNLDREKIEEIQREQLREIISHAEQNTDFYGERIEEDLESFSEIPKLTKEDIQESSDRILSEKSENKPSYISTTSGTSRDPLETFIDSRSHSYMKAVSYRTYRRYGTGFLSKKVIFTSKGTDRDLKDIFSNTYYISFEENNSDACKELEKIDPELISGTPSKLRPILYKDPDIDPELITTVGETSDNPTKNRMKERFDCKVRDVYSSEEFGKIAWECPECGYYHVNSDLVKIEDQGDTALVTSLSNYLMPMIRFDIGDKIEFKNSNCSKYPYPTLKSIRGRKDSFIILKDQKYYSLDLKNKFYSIDGIKRFKVEKLDETLHISVAKAEGFSKHVIKKEIEKEIESMTDLEPHVEFRDISLNQNQKLQVIER